MLPCDVEPTTPNHVSPPHYADMVIEPRDFIEANGMEYWRGNVIKYASRAGSKDYPGKSRAESEIADLEKAINYLEDRIRRLRAQDPTWR